MEQQPCYIVFQCYGNEGVFHECGYALLSLALLCKRETSPASLQVWIYTDNPGWFDVLKGINLSLNFRAIDRPTIQQWYGKVNFVHRMKIEVLKDFTKERHGNVLYADTDVVFTGNLHEMLRGISAGNLYMHTMEGIISDKGNPLLSKLDAHLRANVQRKVTGKPLYDLAMWNAGVLGFNTKYTHLLNDVLEFTDREYPKFPKHIIEQFAFSVYFQQAADVKAASPYMVHYWNLKEAREMLASFFSYFHNKGIEEMMRCSALMQIHVLMQEKMNFIHNRTIAGKLMKKEWHPGSYDWAILMKQL